MIGLTTTGREKRKRSALPMAVELMKEANILLEMSSRKTNTESKRSRASRSPISVSFLASFTSLEIFFLIRHENKWENVLYFIALLLPGSLAFKQLNVLALRSEIGRRDVTHQAAARMALRCHNVKRVVTLI
jgi:hypothetical protein